MKTGLWASSGDSMTQVLFYERQTFSPVVYGLALAAGLGGLAALAPGAGAHMGGGRVLGGMAILGVAVLIINLSAMTTLVTPAGLRVEFGRLFPLYRKRFLIGDITKVEAVTYKPLRHAGGWGIRTGRFNGEWAHFLNMRGAQGVLIRAQGKTFIIGSQRPGELAQTVQKALDS